jgi:hypothetical protein
MSFNKTHVIINPASAGGKTGKKQDKILHYLDRYFGKRYSLCVTQKPLDASISTREAIAAGSELIITIGGDKKVTRQYCKKVTRQKILYLFRFFVCFLLLYSKIYTRYERM